MMKLRVRTPKISYLRIRSSGMKKNRGIIFNMVTSELTEIDSGTIKPSTALILRTNIVLVKLSGIRVMAW